MLNSFTHIIQGYFTGIGAIILLPQCQWINPEGYGWMFSEPCCKNTNDGYAVNKIPYSLTFRLCVIYVRENNDSSVDSARKA